MAEMFDAAAISSLDYRLKERAGRRRGKIYRKCVCERDGYAQEER